MIAVICEGIAPDSRLAEWAQAQQSRFRLEPRIDTPGAIRICFSDELADTPWRLRPEENLAVLSSWRCAELARYAGRSRREYLLLSSILALTQLRTLVLNPLLTPDDFIHCCEKPCLFANAPDRPLDRFIVAAERLAVCPGCGEFYCCLGAEPEWIAVREILQNLQFRN